MGGFEPSIIDIRHTNPSDTTTAISLSNPRSEVGGLTVCEYSWITRAATKQCAYVWGIGIISGVSASSRDVGRLVYSHLLVSWARYSEDGFALEPCSGPPGEERMT